MKRKPGHSRSSPPRFSPVPTASPDRHSDGASHETAHLPRAVHPASPPVAPGAPSRGEDTTSHDSAAPPESEAGSFSETAPPDPSNDEKPREAVVPASADEWRALLRNRTGKALIELVVKNKKIASHLLAGFRPTPDLVRNPVFVDRLLTTLQRNPEWARTVAELLTTNAQSPTKRDDTPKSTTTKASSILAKGPIPAPKTTPNANELALKQRVKELEKTLAGLRRQVDNTNKEAAKLRESTIALRDEIAVLNGDLRLQRKAARHRQNQLENLRMALDTAKREAKERPKRVPVTQSAQQTGSDSSTTWMASVEALLRSGRVHTVITLLVALNEQETIAPTVKARANRLLAEAHHIDGNPEGWLDATAEAAGAYLSDARVLDAIDMIIDAVAQVRPTDPLDRLSWILTRVLKMAERDKHEDAVVERFARLRRLHPSLANRFGKLETFRTAKWRTLWNRSAPDAPVLTVLPDETVALPSPRPDVATSTPRRIVAAVAAGDTAKVAAISDALRTLALHRQDLTNAILQCVAEMEPGFQIPLQRIPGSAALIDASNVARYDPDPTVPQDTAKMFRLERMRRTLLHEGYFPIVAIADANLRHLIDNPAVYEHWEQSGALVDCGPGTAADSLLLREALHQRALLVSNDRFDDHDDTETVRLAEFRIAPDGNPFLL